MIRLWKFFTRRVRILNERLHGLDFSSVMQPQDLGLNAALVFRGTPSGNKYLRAVMADLPLRQSDAIIDIGCAKGSAMACMSEFPFARVEGIEISSILAVICAGNFKRLKRSHVKVHNIDATQFKQYDTFQYFYFYNPFPVQILKKVLYQITEQVKDLEIVVIYNNPPCEITLKEFGFTKKRVYPDEWGNGIHLYTNCMNSSKLDAESNSFVRKT